MNYFKALGDFVAPLFDTFLAVKAHERNGRDKAYEKTRQATEAMRNRISAIRDKLHKRT